VPELYTYEFADGEFSFHTAINEEGEQVVFRSRMDTWPSVRAAAKGITYKFLRNSDEGETQEWLNSHPQCEVISKNRLP
jgi:hypothetical protein